MKLRTATLLVGLLATTIPLSCLADVRITGFSNFAFGTWVGSGDLQNSDDLCVYNSATSNYQITATGDGVGSAFTLDSSGIPVAYEVYWNDSTGTSGNVQLTTNSTLHGQSGANTSSETCGGSNNANLEIFVPEGSLSTVTAGSFSGTLTILLEPD